MDSEIGDSKTVSSECSTTAMFKVDNTLENNTADDEHSTTTTTSMLLTEIESSRNLVRMLQEKVTSLENDLSSLRHQTDSDLNQRLRKEMEILIERNEVLEKENKRLKDLLQVNKKMSIDDKEEIEEYNEKKPILPKASSLSNTNDTTIIDNNEVDGNEITIMNSDSKERLRSLSSDIPLKKKKKRKLPAVGALMVKNMIKSKLDLLRHHHLLYKRQTKNDNKKRKLNEDDEGVKENDYNVTNVEPNDGDDETHVCVYGGNTTLKSTNNNNTNNNNKGVNDGNSLNENSTSTTKNEQNNEIIPKSCITQVQLSSTIMNSKQLSTVTSSLSRRASPCFDKNDTKEESHHYYYPIHNKHTIFDVKFVSLPRADSQDEKEKLFMASAGSDKNIFLTTTKTTTSNTAVQKEELQLVNILKGHTDTVTSLSVLQTENKKNKVILASASHDKTIRMWDLNQALTSTTLASTTNTAPLTLHQQPQTSYCIKLLKNPQKVWSLDNFRINDENHKNNEEDETFILACGCEDGSISITSWNTNCNQDDNCQSSNEGKRHDGGVCSLQFLSLKEFQDGKKKTHTKSTATSTRSLLLISGSCDETCIVWTVSKTQTDKRKKCYSLECMKILCGNTSYIYSLCAFFHHHKKPHPNEEEQGARPYLAAGKGGRDSKGCVIKLWDLSNVISSTSNNITSNTDVQDILIGHTCGISSIRFLRLNQSNISEAKEYLCSSSWDMKIILWDLYTRSMVSQISLSHELCTLDAILKLDFNTHQKEKKEKCTKNTINIAVVAGDNNGNIIRTSFSKSITPSPLASLPQHSSHPLLSVTTKNEQIGHCIAKNSSSVKDSDTDCGELTKTSLNLGSTVHLSPLTMESKAMSVLEEESKQNNDKMTKNMNISVDNTEYKINPPTPSFASTVSSLTVTPMNNNKNANIFKDLVLNNNVKNSFQQKNSNALFSFSSFTTPKITNKSKRRRRTRMKGLSRSLSKAANTLLDGSNSIDDNDADKLEMKRRRI